MLIRWDFSQLFGYADRLNQAPEVLTEELQIATQESLAILAEPLEQPNERPPYPINWDSPQQARAFFASDGFGRGIPTERTGELEQSWQKAIQSTAGSVIGSLITNLYYAAYTRGLSAQSAIFQGVYEPAVRIWGGLRLQVEEEFMKAVERALNRIR